MYVDPTELQLKRQLEQALGRSVSDIEWESFKQAASQTTIENSTPKAGRAWEWTGQDRAFCFAALLALLASVGMFLEANFMFSPFIKITLGIGLWLVALVALRALFSSAFVMVFILVVWSGIGGWDLLTEDREFLTSSHSVADRWAGKGATPAELVAFVLILVAVFLAMAGRPVRRGRD